MLYLLNTKSGNGIFRNIIFQNRAKEGINKNI